MKKTIIFRVVFDDIKYNTEFSTLQEANNYVDSTLDEVPDVKEAKVLRIEQNEKLLETIRR